MTRCGLSCLVAATEPLTDLITKSVKNSFRFPGTENVYSTAACNLVHLFVYCLVVQTHVEDYKCVRSVVIQRHDILRTGLVIVSFIFLNCRCKSQNWLRY